MLDEPIHTYRFILRELAPGDEHDLFELDLNPEVQRFLGENCAGSPEESIKVIDHIYGQVLALTNSRPLNSFHLHSIKYLLYIGAAMPSINQKHD